MNAMRRWAKEKKSSKEMKRSEIKRIGGGRLEMWSKHVRSEFRNLHTVQYSTVQYSTVQYSTVQYSTVQYNTVQYSTIQYSTVQYNTIHHTTSCEAPTCISEFIWATALTLVVDFGLLMSELRNKNWRLRLLFSIWSISVTYTVPSVRMEQKVSWGKIPGKNEKLGRDFELRVGPSL